MWFSPALSCPPFGLSQEMFQSPISLGLFAFHAAAAPRFGSILLPLQQIPIGASLSQQLLVRPLLRDLPVFHHQNVVGTFHKVEAV